MGAMACVASAVKHGFVDVRLREPGLRVGMTGKADLVHPVLHHAGKVRTVRIVTLAARILHQGGVRVSGLLGGLRLFMTGEAKVPVLLHEQIFVLRGVRRVARPAAGRAVDGRVSEAYRRSFRGMTGEAQGIVRLRKQLRILGVMRIMAGEAHTGLEGSMQLVPARL